MEMDIWKFVFDRAKHAFVVANAQIGMKSALHEDPRAAEGDGLLDFFKDRLEREEVAVFRADGTIESTKGTILGAKICVIDVAVDLVSDHPRVVLLATD